MKYLFLDTETSGLSENCTPIQISFEIIINGKVMETCDFRVRPFEDSVIEQAALDFLGLTEEEIWNYPETKTVYQQILKIFSKYINKFDKTDKFIICGQNVSFDIQKMNYFFNKNNNKFLGSYLDFGMKLDTLYLAQSLQIAKIMPRLANNKLETLCEYFDIEVDKFHDSLEDIKATRKVARELLKLLKGNAYENIGN